MNQSYDVCVIGAGASGLAAANSMDKDLRIAIVDKNRIPGRKILATGGGRCNLTNEACPGRQMTLDFFHGLGLEAVPDSQGRYYPYSRRASDVVEVLVKGLEDHRIDWFFETEVMDVKKEEDFTLILGSTDGSGRQEISARCLILCAGGKAAPAYGTTGSGYSLARKLGHSVSRTYPILTGINCPIPDDVAGIRARAQVSLIEDGREVARQAGEIQFTKEGISGICVFDLSPYIKAGPDEKPTEAFKRYKVKIDLAPDFTVEELEKRESSFGIVTRELARWVSPRELKSLELPVEGVWGWDKAQATAGGIPMEEVDASSFGSRICTGLYIAGEILDVQGPCGGFNLQHAWQSGMMAGRSADLHIREGMYR